MKPPACVRCKWGTGTVPTGAEGVRPTNSESSKELQLQLESLMAQRATQDMKWFPTTTYQTQTASSLVNDFGNSKK
jgi:hypothetical protein